MKFNKSGGLVLQTSHLERAVPCGIVLFGSVLHLGKVVKK